jgi:hypothetical protein
MSANRSRRKTASRQGAPATPAATAGPLANRIKAEVTARMKQRLGLPESEKIPAPIQDLVDSAARDAAENAVEIAVIREVEHVTTRLARGSPGRNEGSNSPTNLSDVALLQEAEQLAAKKKALEAAGFSSDEAMRILIAEVVGGHSQSPGS